MVHEVLTAGAVFGALFVGWVGGMLTFKRSQMWCPDHGVELRCPECGPARRNASAGTPR